jgi:hypothetical protein
VELEALGIGATFTVIELSMPRTRWLAGWSKESPLPLVVRWALLRRKKVLKSVLKKEPSTSDDR